MNNKDISGMDRTGAQHRTKICWRHLWSSHSVWYCTSHICLQGLNAYASRFQMHPKSAPFQLRSRILSRRYFPPPQCYRSIIHHCFPSTSLQFKNSRRSACACDTNQFYRLNIWPIAFIRVVFGFHVLRLFFPSKVCSVATFNMKNYNPDDFKTFSPDYQHLRVFLLLRQKKVEINQSAIDYAANKTLKWLCSCPQNLRLLRINSVVGWNVLKNDKIWGPWRLTRASRSKGAWYLSLVASAIRIDMFIDGDIVINTSAKSTTWKWSPSHVAVTVPKSLKGGRNVEMLHIASSFLFFMRFDSPFYRNCEVVVPATSHC